MFLHDLSTEEDCSSEASVSSIISRDPKPSPLPSESDLVGMFSNSDKVGLTGDFGLLLEGLRDKVGILVWVDRNIRSSAT